MIKQIIDWCNENEGTIAFLGLVFTVLGAVLYNVVKIVCNIMKKNKVSAKNKKEKLHNNDIEEVVSYIEQKIAITPQNMAKDLEMPLDKAKSLLYELEQKGVIRAACDNCEIENPFSIWELNN